MTTFLLIRHGSTDMLDVGISGWKPLVGLNARGRAEVTKLAARLVERRIDVLYTSPLERAQQTAEAVGRPSGLQPIACSAVGELRFGDWTGKSFEALSPDAAWQRFNSFRSGTRIPGGELMVETQSRSVAALLSLRERHEAETVAVVTHGDVIKSVLCYFLGMPLDLHGRLEVAPASVSELQLGPDWVKVVRVNEVVA